MWFVAERIFIDTSVLVYAHDRDVGEKHAIAEHVLRQLWADKAGALSVQVLQEFYVNVTRKFAKQLSDEQILLATRTLGRLRVVEVSVQMIFSAIGLARQFRLSFWDSLILEAALESQCKLLLTEDLQHGQRIGSLTIENPFL